MRLRRSACPAAALSASPAVPPTCHIGRTRPVPSGQPRSLTCGRSPGCLAPLLLERIPRMCLISRGAALRRRPFPGENRGGCPLMPDVLGRWRPLISRVLGAASGPFTVASSTRIRFACRPAAPAGNHLSGRRSAGRPGAGGDARQRSDHPAGRGLGRGQGRADLLYTGLGPGQLGPADGRRSGPTRQ
jgi:hypothetical protein